MRICTAHGRKTRLPDGMNEVRLDVFDEVPDTIGDEDIITLCGRDISSVPESFRGLVDVGDSDVRIPFRKIRSVHKDHTPEDILALMPDGDQEISKGAFTARSFADLHNIYHSGIGIGRKHIILGMGEFGRITRLRQNILGNEFTFAYDKSATAPGQFSRKDMLALGDGCVVAGLVGDVPYGLSHAVEREMRRSSVNGVCLEFRTDDLDHMEKTMAEYDIRGMFVFGRDDDTALNEGGKVIFVSSLRRGLEHLVSLKGGNRFRIIGEGYFAERARRILSESDSIADDSCTVIDGDEIAAACFSSFLETCFGIEPKEPVIPCELKGHGISYGAVSVLNAIPCGIGSTIGVELRTEADYTEGTGSKEIILKDRQDMSADLAGTCVEETLKALGMDPGIGYRLEISSEIPPSFGLKSSSSVCNAVISAVLDAHGAGWDITDIIRLGVGCARRCGVTVTGSFDDACGCAFGGLVVTDNRDDTILESTDIEDMDVVICLPEGTHRKASPEEYRLHAEEFASLVEGLPGRYREVMVRNGKLVGEISGMPQFAEKAMSLGAYAAGISGTGPSTAVLVGKGCGKDIAERLGCRYILTSVRKRMICFSGGEPKGTVTAPPSKSMTHRAFVMAALAGGRSVIRSPSMCADTLSTLKAVGSMGADAAADEDNVTIVSEKIHSPKFVDAGNSGTTLRFMTAVSSLFDGETVLTGDRSLCRRPMTPLLEALSACGAKISSDNGKAPLTVKGPVSAERIVVDGSTSSQFVSAMMIISPMFGKDVEMEIAGKAVSVPYIDMTLRMMREFGASAERTGNVMHIGSGYRAGEVGIPGDYSLAAYLLVAGAVAGDVTVKGLDTSDASGDGAILEILRKTGCSVEITEDGVRCRRIGRPKAIDVDMSDIPDLFPITAVLLSTAEGTSCLYGAPHLRLKESDRIGSTVRMLRSLGADVTETDGGCTIHGVGRLRGGRVEHEDDHRIFMSAAIASFLSDGPIYMENSDCYCISYPGFTDALRSLTR